MKLPTPEARRRFTAAPVARLATASANGLPHLVPVTFAADEDGATLYFAVDHKPKSTWDLRRLRNIRENPAVTLLVDHYAADWSALWWSRADGRATIHEDDDRLPAIRALQHKYPQYAHHPPTGPVVAIHVTTWTGWSFT